MEDGEEYPSVSRPRASPSPRDCHKASGRGKAGRSSSPPPCLFAERHSQDLPPSVSSVLASSGPRLWLLPFSLTAHPPAKPVTPAGLSTWPPHRRPGPGTTLSLLGPCDLLPVPISAILLALPFLLSNPFKIRSDQVLLHKTLQWPQKPRSLTVYRICPLPLWQLLLFPTETLLGTLPLPARFASRVLPRCPPWPWSLSVP